MDRQKLYLILIFSLFSVARTIAQRQEIAISPVGFVQPKWQVVQYERYVGNFSSLVASAYHNSSRYGLAFFKPPGTQRTSLTEIGIGYRQYVNLQNDLVSLFASVRVLGGYSILQLRSDSQFNIPSDSLRVAGFTLTPDFSLGGKLLIARRITFSGAIGYQYRGQLFSGENITRNPAYWDSFYWTNDSQSWDYKRNKAVNFRQGWRPSIQFTIGVVLGKKVVKQY